MTDITTPRIRELNDALRQTTDTIGMLLANGQLVVTRGVAERGNDFIDRAFKAVRTFSDFSEDNDPHGEHDFGIFELDGETLNRTTRATSLTASSDAIICIVVE